MHHFNLIIKFNNVNIQVKFQGNGKTGFVTKKLEGFSVGNATAKYILKVKNADRNVNSGTIKAITGSQKKVTINRCFQSKTKAQFSTYDSENCACPNKDCAFRRGAGWWVTGCTDKCNPLGMMYKTEENEFREDRMNAIDDILKSEYAQFIKDITIYFEEKA